ncbi:MAG: hypothetical protein U1D33_00765, partial [bacterium]|nr:hypothetical protein [bacterium]
RPAVAFDPVRKNYLIVWDEKGAGGAGDIYAKLVGEEGTAVRVARKKISAARPLQGCLFSGFAEATGLSAPTDCKENVEPSAAYSDGRFLITWTKRGKAVRPAEEGFSVILGMLVDAGTLEPVSNDWKEGILLSKITFASANAGQAARNDSEVQAFAENEHAAVSAAGGAFLLVWDSNKDFVSCHEAARRGAFSIYGRVIPVAFNPRGGNRDIFPIYTDPSTALAECAPNADVSHARKPRLAYLSATKQYLVVFEVAKNVSSALPSVGGIVVSLANDLTQTVSSIHDFAPLDRQIHEGCYDPDVVATADRFLLSDEIGHEKLKLTEVTVNRGNIVPGLSRVFEAPDDLPVRRPRRAVNRVAGAEGGAQTYPLEYVAAYEAHADARRSTASQIHVVSFSLSLEPMDPRVVMPAGEYPIQLNPAVASAGAKVLTAWNGQSGEESRILSSLVTVNAPSVPNQKPAARITVTGHEEVPVVIFAGETISLSGLESSDPEDGLNLSSYRWQQVLGPLGRFADVNAAETDFIAPNVSTAANVALRLVVKDRQGLASDPAQIAVRVLPPAAVNKPPVAKISLVGAGGGIPITDLTVNESPSPDPVYDPVTGLPSWPRTRITLSGQFSNNGETPPGAVVSHRWEQVVEDATLLISGVSGENTPEFSFTVPNVLRSRGSVVITIRLTVDDDGTADNTASQDLRITVRDLNHSPTAPVLSSPTEGESFIPVRILLDWQDSIDPDIAEGDQLFYDVYWDADNPPATLIPVCNGISASRCILTDLLPQTAYSWKVRVRDLANEDLPVFYSPVAGFNTTTVDIQARWRFDDG